MYNIYFRITKNPNLDLDLDQYLRNLDTHGRGLTGGFRVRAIKLSSYPCYFRTQLKSVKIFDTTILAVSNSFQIAFSARSVGSSRGSNR